MVRNHSYIYVFVLMFNAISISNRRPMMKMSLEFTRTNTAFPLLFVKQWILFTYQNDIYHNSFICKLMMRYAYNEWYIGM